jgi:hypothetical protein
MVSVSMYVMLVVAYGVSGSAIGQAGPPGFDFHPDIVHLTDANSMAQSSAVDGRDVWILAFYNSGFVKSSRPTVGAVLYRPTR